MRVGIYARVSTSRQETDNQLRILREYCQETGHEIAVEYVDDGITACGKKKRPAFDRMLAAAYRREFQMLLFWSIDRLSREGASTTLQLLEKLDRWGLSWRSHTEPYFDSCGVFKDAVISIMATIAKLERQKISERTRAGLARTKAKGTILGRRRNAQAHHQAVALHLAEPALSARAIARRTGISLGTVQRAVRERRALITT